MMECVFFFPSLSSCSPNNREESSRIQIGPIQYFSTDYAGATPLLFIKSKEAHYRLVRELRVYFFKQSFMYLLSHVFRSPSLFRRLQQCLSHCSTGCSKQGIQGSVSLSFEEESVGFQNLEGMYFVVIFLRLLLISTTRSCVSCLFNIAF